jgi:hypothetical protein
MRPAATAAIPTSKRDPTMFISKRLLMEYVNNCNIYEGKREWSLMLSPPRSRRLVSLRLKRLAGADCIPEDIFLEELKKKILKSKKNVNKTLRSYSKVYRVWNGF